MAKQGSRRQLTPAEVDENIRQFFREKRDAAARKRLAPDMLAVLRFIEPVLSGFDEAIDGASDMGGLRQAARMVREVLGKADAAGI